MDRVLIPVLILQPELASRLYAAGNLLCGGGQQRRVWLHNGYNGIRELVQYGIMGFQRDGHNLTSDEVPQRWVGHHNHIGACNRPVELPTGLLREIHGDNLADGGTQRQRV